VPLANDLVATRVELAAVMYVPDPRGLGGFDWLVFGCLRRGGLCRWFCAGASLALFWRGFQAHFGVGCHGQAILCRGFGFRGSWGKHCQAVRFLAPWRVLGVAAEPRLVLTWHLLGDSWLREECWFRPTWAVGLVLPGVMVLVALDARGAVEAFLGCPILVGLLIVEVDFGGRVSF